MVHTLFSLGLLVLYFVKYFSKKYFQKRKKCQNQNMQNYVEIQSINTLLWIG